MNLEEVLEEVGGVLAPETGMITVEGVTPYGYTFKKEVQFRNGVTTPVSAGSDSLVATMNELLAL